MRLPEALAKDRASIREELLIGALLGDHSTDLVTTIQIKPGMTTMRRSAAISDEAKQFLSVLALHCVDKTALNNSLSNTVEITWYLNKDYIWVEHIYPSQLGGLDCQNIYEF